MNKEAFLYGYLLEKQAQRGDVNVMGAGDEAISPLPQPLTTYHTSRGESGNIEDILKLKSKPLAYQEWTGEYPNAGSKYTNAAKVWNKYKK